MSWLELDLLLNMISNVIFPQLLRRITRGHAGTMFRPNGQNRINGLTSKWSEMITLADIQLLLSSIFEKINWVNFLMSFFWKFNFLTRFSKSKKISVLVGG